MERRGFEAGPAEPAGLGLLKRPHRPREDAGALRSMVRERRRAEAGEGELAAAPAGNRRDEHLPSLELAHESCRRCSGRVERLEQSILAAAERLAAAPGGEGEKPGWERRMREAMRRAFGAELAAVPSIAAEAKRLGLDAPDKDGDIIRLEQALA